MSYLLVVAAFARGFSDNPDILPSILAVVITTIALLAAEPLLSRKSRFAAAFVIAGQVLAMAAGFIIAPQTDTWALLLLPSCIAVVRDYPRWTGWIWIAVFSVAMSALIVYNDGLVGGAEFFGLYIAVYVLMGSYSQALKNAHAAQSRSSELVEELQAAQVQLQHYADGAAQLASMRERNRIARDLHDSVTQTIFSMTLLTESALILQNQDPAQARERLQQLSGLANGALTEMRALIAELRDTDGTAGRLVAGIRHHVDEFATSQETRIDLEIIGDIPALLPDTERELTSIVQEALNNVSKHAHAANIVVRVQTGTETLTLQIEDDGIGFDTGAHRDLRRHIGLSCMRERAEEVGGRLSVDSEKGRGTVVSIILDLPKADASNSEGR